MLDKNLLRTKTENLSWNLAEEDMVYSVLLIITWVIVEFSKHFYYHIFICSNMAFGICKAIPSFFYV
jgi:hypothetical protein